MWCKNVALEYNSSRVFLFSHGLWCKYNDVMFALNKFSGLFLLVK